MQLFNHVPLISDILGLHATPKACLFDMDGTIMDTEIIHAQALYELVQLHHPNKYTECELYELCLGQTDDFIFDTLRAQNCFLNLTNEKLEALKLEIFLRILKTTPSNKIFIPQIKSLLSELKDKGIKLAVVTSSDKLSAMALLDLLDVAQYFELFITKEDTKLNKPHPDPYLMAYKTLGCEAQECLIFEDSPTGLKAAEIAAPKAIIKAGWYKQVKLS